MCHPAGADVLNPAQHAMRRVGAYVELQDERPVGWQLE
jgi:hypothetical protein